MRHDVFGGCIGLRVDVDFALGLRCGVPRVLSVLGAHSMKATFFVVAGRNPVRAHARRLVRKGYLARLRRLGIGRLVAAALRAAWSAPGPRGTGELASDQRDALARIRDEGHELGVHGYDHAWWVEHVWRAAEADLEAEIERGMAATAAAVGSADLAWASPGWRSSEHVVGLLARRGVPYLSECWGRSPFRGRTASGEPLGPVHLPITLPCLEAVPTNRSKSACDIARAILDRAIDSYNLCCGHAYHEGILHVDGLKALTACLADRGLTTVTLRDLAARVDAAGVALPSCGLTRGPLDGFVGDVTWQGEPDG